MRLKYSLALALLLSGCQMTSPDSTTSTPETNKSELAAKQKAAKEQAKSKQSLTDAVKETPKVLSPQEQEDVWQRIAMQLEMDIPHNKRWITTVPGI